MAAYTCSFIGTGSMGGALARAVCRTLPPAEVLLSNRTPSCQMPSTALLLHALCQETSGLPGVPRPRGKGRLMVGGAAGQGAEGAWDKS